MNIDEIRERRQKRYLGLGSREHRNYHENHLVYAEELHDCIECEDEREEELSASKEAMLADIDHLLAVQSTLAKAMLDEVEAVYGDQREGYSEIGLCDKRLRNLFTRLGIQMEMRNENS